MTFPGLEIAFLKFHNISRFSMPVGTPSTFSSSSYIINDEPHIATLGLIYVLTASTFPHSQASEGHSMKHLW